VLKNDTRVLYTFCCHVAVRCERIFVTIFKLAMHRLGNLQFLNYLPPRDDSA